MYKIIEGNKGASLLNVSGYDFVQDIVIINGKHSAKVGRGYIENPNLKKFKLV